MSENRSHWKYIALFIVFLIASLLFGRYVLGESFASATCDTLIGLIIAALAIWRLSSRK